jgi:hypothetical protein
MEEECPTVSTRPEKELLVQPALAYQTAANSVQITKETIKTMTLN